MRALAMGLVLLGLCVFAWGLRYKLSLYEPPHSVGTHMPAAKLLAGKERAALPTVNLRRAGSDDVPPVVVHWWVLAAFPPVSLRLWPGTRRWAQSFAVAHFLPGTGGSASSFVRPPPSLL